MKNIEKKSMIKEKNYKKVQIAAGIVVTGLFLTYMQPEKKEVEPIKEETISTQDSGFNRYSTIYLDQLKNIDRNEFDKEFLNLYNHGIVVYNEKEYPYGEIYIEKDKDHSVHFFTSDNVDYALFTNEKLPDERLAMARFNDSTCFLNMYEDGILKEDKTELNKEVFQAYAANWDGEKHEAIPKLKAEKMANKIYHEKYGGTK